MVPTVDFETPEKMFQVTPHVSDLPVLPGEPDRTHRAEVDDEDTEPRDLAEISEQDLMPLTEALWSIPVLIWDKLTPRTPKQLTPFNHALSIYCRRKGIDPYSMFFDEFPLVLATIGVGGGMYREYKELYPKKPKGSGKQEEWKEDTVTYNVEKKKEEKEGVGHHEA